MNLLQKLASEANRRGARGRDALAVLQDALLERFPVDFEGLQEISMRDYHAVARARFIVYDPIADRIFATTGSILAAQPMDRVIVWSTQQGFDVFRDNQNRLRAWRADERERPVLRLRVARVRLDRSGRDSGGFYWGHGSRPLFRVTSDEPLTDTYVPAPYSHARTLGHNGPRGFYVDTYVDTYVRAASARAARADVAERLSVRGRSRDRS